MSGALLTDSAAHPEDEIREGGACQQDRKEDRREDERENLGGAAAYSPKDPRARWGLRLGTVDPPSPA